MRAALAVGLAVAALAFTGPVAAHTQRVDLTDPLPCHGSVCEPLIWYGHKHRDVVDGTRGEEHLYGRGGPDKLVGHREADWLLGGPGADRLFGGRSHDHMWGGPGDDYIDCGPSHRHIPDVAYGGPGADVFISCEFIEDFDRSEGDRRKP